MPSTRNTHRPRHNTAHHPDVLLYDRWPPWGTRSSTIACPAGRPSKPIRRRKPRIPASELAELRTSIACILQMHVDGDPYAHHLYVTPVPPGRRKNSRVSADPSGWPLYIARRDRAAAPAVIAFDVIADEPPSHVAAHIAALTARRPREIVLICMSGLPKLPARSVRVRQDHRAAERRRHEPCVLVGQSSSYGSRANWGTNGCIGGGLGGDGGSWGWVNSYNQSNRGGVLDINDGVRAGHGSVGGSGDVYTWVVLSGMEYLELRGLMVAAWADQLTVAGKARELAGSSGYQYALMYCAMIDVILTEPDSSRLRTTRCDDATLAFRARAMAERFRVPWGPMLQTMKDIARVERERRRRPRSLGTVDKFS